MKKSILIITSMLFLSAGAIFGQDIHKSQVPSLVLNSFQQAFPKALDAEWEMEGDLFKVEFETGILRTSHDVLLDKTGKILRHKEEISKNDLPKPVSAKISSDFPGYRIDDVEKITEGNKTVYTLELKKLHEDWKVAFDPEGNILSKIAD